jgi:DNA-binding transcriptional LysR family regulator
VAGARNFDFLAVGPHGIPAFEVGVDGSVCSRDQHPAWFASPRGRGDDSFEIVSEVEHMGIAILPASAVKHSVASVIACDILDEIPMSEIGIAVSKGVGPAVVDNFRSFALEKLGRARKSSRADQS